ncbi:TPA: hypothetical protein N0F65_000972 [Lagenidium giganteum]|uniref:EGF-like domain-containing protein n=1 Tax=Lagenidium giganteum TaxID=4803 RepID=A0AAV2YZ15_9STRA|nr:TPA: hypothetical protein N0F65_000972 [Lagenidium giganteum]
MSWLAGFIRGCIHDHLPHKVIGHDQAYHPDHPFRVAERRRLQEDQQVDDGITNTQHYDTASSSSYALYAPIRITPYYDNDTINLLPASQQDVLFRLVPDAIRRFRSMLSVVPVQGNLMAKRSCVVQYQTTPIVCKTVQTQEQCLEMPIPSDHFGPTLVCSTCVSAGCSRGKCSTIPGQGVPDSDFVIYVRAVNTTFCNGQVLAYASSCQKDQYDRPTFGMANFCPTQISSDPHAYEAQLATALHEMTHALGFSAQFFAYMRNADGSPRTFRDLYGRPRTGGRCPNGDYVDGFPVPSSSTVQVSRERNHTVAKMITPAVAKFVQDHFGCKELRGAELENQDEGCMGSHWEERLFEPEYMTPVSSFVNTISGLTLAFFEDSGWYKTNTAAASRLHFGAGRGCTFATSPCIDKATETPLAMDHYCTSKDAESCSVDATSRSVCFINSGRDIPKIYQYFTSDSTRGGTNSFADFCPINSGYSLGDCRLEINLQYPPGTTTNLMGEAYCPTCKCTRTTLTLKNSGWAMGSRRKTGCYRMECPSPDIVQIHVPLASGEDGEYVVNCTTPGDTHNVPGYTGTIACPDPAVVCETTCPRACGGHGLCNFSTNTCSCDNGWIGDDCATNASAPSTRTNADLRNINGAQPSRGSGAWCILFSMLAAGWIALLPV